MAKNSAYCKAYTANTFRSFQDWTENTSSLRKGTSIVDEKEVEFERAKIEDGDVLYLHDSYVVTDGIFVDENVVFNNVTDTWKAFCTEQLKFSIPDHRRKDQPVSVPSPA